MAKIVVLTEPIILERFLTLHVGYRFKYMNTCGMKSKVVKYQKAYGVIKIWFAYDGIETCHYCQKRGACNKKYDPELASEPCKYFKVWEVIYEHNPDKVRNDDD